MDVTHSLKVVPTFHSNVSSNDETSYSGTLLSFFAESCNSSVFKSGELLPISKLRALESDNLRVCPSSHPSASAKVLSADPGRKWGRPWRQEMVL